MPCNENRQDVVSHRCILFVRLPVVRSHGQDHGRIERRFGQKRRDSGAIEQGIIAPADGEKAPTAKGDKMLEKTGEPGDPVDIADYRRRRAEREGA